MWKLKLTQRDRSKGEGQVGEDGLACELFFWICDFNIIDAIINSKAYESQSLAGWVGAESALSQEIVNTYTLSEHSGNAVRLAASSPRPRARECASMRTQTGALLITNMILLATCYTTISEKFKII
jgi:hypothetical protein